MEFIPCPYFDGVVELTDERQEHIAFGHPELMAGDREDLFATIEYPDDVLPTLVGHKHMFVRWADTIRGGRYVVAVVISDPEQDRHWLATAYTAHRAPEAL